MKNLEACIENGLHLTDCDNDGFCNHCGYQEPYVEPTNGKRIFVVGYEDSTGRNSGGFYWFPLKRDANKKAKQLKVYDIVYQGSIKVGKDKDSDTITQIVESFLEWNDWENSFK